MPVAAVSITVNTLDSNGTAGTQTLTLGQFNRAPTTPLPLPNTLKKTDYDTYKNDVTTITNNLQSLLSNVNMPNVVMGQVVDSNTNNYTTLDTNLTNIGTDVLTFNTLADYLKEQSTVDLTDYTAAKQTSEESKLRLDGIRNSDTQVSYYEGWFPLFRPMSETALFSIFSVSITLLLASIAIYLRMQGIELQVTMPASTIGIFAIYETLRQYSSYIWFAIAAGLAIGFAAYKMNWV